MPDEKKDFVVKDRRFASEDESGKEGKDTSADEQKPRDAQDQARSAASSQEPETPLPEINFSTFVISLNASALVHLGQLEDPATGAKTKNLPMAKQTIDILSMLEEKTSGNLTTEEENILKNVLYDLRINYVREKK
jgi:hypothetical protein